MGLVRVTGQDQAVLAGKQWNQIADLIVLPKDVDERGEELVVGACQPTVNLCGLHILGSAQITFLVVLFDWAAVKRERKFCAWHIRELLQLGDSPTVIEEANHVAEVEEDRFHSGGGFVNGLGALKDPLAGYAVGFQFEAAT